MFLVKLKYFMFKNYIVRELVYTKRYFDFDFIRDDLYKIVNNQRNKGNYTVCIQILRIHFLNENYTIRLNSHSLSIL